MQFVSRDVDSVESTWRQFVPTAELQHIDRRTFRFEWSSAQLGGVSAVRYELAAQVRSNVAPEDQLLACRVDGADAGVWTDRSDVDPAQPWLTDGTPVHAKWDRGARVTALVFERAAAQERLRTISGDDGLVLTVTGIGPRSSAASRRWEQAFDYVMATCDLDDGSDPILDAELERHALLMTVAAFSTTFDRLLHRPPQRSGAPATVRRALAFIDDNAHLPVTVDDVAAATFISTRGLQYAFRRALDITPAEALRRARLAGAHRELTAGGDVTIAAVARRWGFSHPSRFAAAYRDAYGVLPSATVHRH